MKRNLNNRSEESKERWEFIEKTFRDVGSWPEWKKVEVCSESDHEREEKNPSPSALHSPKLEFK